MYSLAFLMEEDYERKECIDLVSPLYRMWSRSQKTKRRQSEKEKFSAY
jgi:hypothetical protein